MRQFHVLLMLCALGLVIQGAKADNYPRNPGIDVLHYVFDLTLSDETDSIKGHATVHVRFNSSEVSTFALDLIGREARDSERGMLVSAVHHDGAAIPFAHINNRLTIKVNPTPTRREIRQYQIEYEGVPADGLIIGANKYGDRTFFGDNFPNRARHWLPTLDHPYDKATCEFIITFPAHYQIIASGLLVEKTDLPLSDMRLTHWRQQVPISTYMMVIGVAEFAVQNLEPINGIPLSTWVYPQDRQAGFDDFAEAGKAIAFYSEYIGPYPYRKLANVQSKTRYGGMENPGNIFYSERVVRGTRSNEGLIAHEIAHQWFGDSVTTSDWNHIWLSEGFATYFTHLYMEATYGRPRMVEGLQRNVRRIVAYRDRHPDLAIVDPRIPVDEILSANTYQKAGWVLHMLRRIIGDEHFQESARAYYARFRDANALTEDFQKIVEEISGQDLDWFFQQWFYQPGLPVYEGHWSYDAQAKRVNLTINQVQTDGTFYVMPMDIGIVFDSNDEPLIKTVRIDQRENTFSFPVEHEPIDVVLDPNTWLLMQAEFKKE